MMSVGVPGGAKLPQSLLMKPQLKTSQSLLTRFWRTLPLEVMSSRGDALRRAVVMRYVFIEIQTVLARTVLVA